MSAEDDVGYPDLDPADMRWFKVNDEQWAELLHLLERAPEPKPRLADLLRRFRVYPPGDGGAA